VSKSALIIGISKYPAATDLPGAAQDLTDWMVLLTTRGFAVKALRDAGATKNAIIGEIRTLLKNASSGDNLAVIYSGHGTSALKYDGLVGYFESGSPDCTNTVLTAELEDIIKKCLPAGAKLTTILDCCHARAILPPPPAMAIPEEIQGRPGVANDQVRFLPYDSSSDGLAVRFRNLVYEIHSIGRAILATFSGNDEPLRLAATDEVGSAYEGKMADGKYHGYFSYRLTTIATANPAITHDAAILDARGFTTQHHSDQQPQIRGPRRRNAFLT